MDNIKGIRHDTGYGLIPRAIMRDKTINSQSKAIYSYLASFAGTTGKAFPSVSLMLSELGLSKDTFYKYMNELKNKGYITIEKDRDNGQWANNIYVLNNAPCPKFSDTVNSDTVFSDTVNQDTNINNLNNNNINNNKDIIIMSDLEVSFIKTLETIQDYPVDRIKDIEYMKLMQERYPTLDLIQAIQKWAIYIMDNPFKKNANHRSQLNTSFGKYVEWGQCLKGGTVAKNATVDRVGVPDYITKQDEKYHNTEQVYGYTAEKTDAEREALLERIRKLEEQLNEK